MTRTLATLAFALCAGLVQAGEPAPAFTLPGSSGNVSLESYRGKFVYVDFWASWCAPCKRSFPWMNDLRKRYGDKDLAIVAVNVDASRADAERFLASTPASFTVAYDPAGTTPRQYAIKGMPSSVLVDPTGQIVFRHTGFTSSSARELDEKIAQAMKRGGSE